MSFLQPWMLAALPLIALPVIIHLINQRRYQTTPWAAMMFLLTATRMARGYARLRQWLILMFRVAVITALIFAVARPLSSGWLGLAGGSRPDTTLVLLDRSPSMQQRQFGSETTKLDSAVNQLVQTLSTLGSTRWAVIDSAHREPQELESIDALPGLTAVTATSSSADLPAMLESARDYIAANRPGRTDIWIASDLQASDWNADSARWQTLRDEFQSFPQGVRFHLLAFPQDVSQNVAVSVVDSKRVETGQGAELWLSLRLARHGEAEDRISVPVTIEIEGARSLVPVELVGVQAELKDHRIALPPGHRKGWGMVSIPADANVADNQFYFVFDETPPRHSVIVAEQPAVGDLLEVAATISPDAQNQSTAELLTPARMTATAWEEVSLLLWQGALPDGDAAREVERFITRGGQAIFFPSPQAADTTFLGVTWDNWVEDATQQRIESWRGDQDLLSNTASGAALPVGQIELQQRMELTGEFTPLATLAGGDALIGRVLQGSGAAYFCGTTPEGAHSSLAQDGVVFYVMVQRALAAGTAALGDTRQLIAGAASPQRRTSTSSATAADPSTDEAQPEQQVLPTDTWQQLAGPESTLSNEYLYQAGVYADEDRLLAVNRPAAEDEPSRVQDDRLAELFRDLDFTRVDTELGREAGLVQEVWRLFVVAMIAAMMFEAGLSMPHRARSGGLKP